MNFVESEEQVLLRDTVRKIASSYGYAYFHDLAMRDEKPHAIWRTLGEHGLIGVNIPEEYGGSGMGIYELSIVCEELAATGVPLLMLVVTPAICASVITKHGTEEQKKEWLPAFSTGEKKMVFAITEPGAGSNSHKISTTARKDGDDYLITGQKYFISGIDDADAVLVVARTEVGPGDRSKLSLFAVDVDSPGLSTSLIPVEVVAPEKQFTVFFEDVRVPKSRLVGQEHDGLRTVFSGLNPERITVAAISNGIARYALEKAVKYATEREVWGVPIGSHQGLSHPLAKAKIDLELAKLMTDKAGSLYDAGEDAGEAANMAKLAAADAALFALDQAIQTHGGNGLTTEFGLAPMWGVARVLKTAPVSREMILNYVAQRSLGLPRSY